VITTFHEKITPNLSNYKHFEKLIKNTFAKLSIYEVMVVA